MAYNSSNARSTQEAIEDETGETLLEYETSTLLSIVLDINPIGWYNIKKEGSNCFYFRNSLEQILVFINAFLANSHNNSISLVAAHPNNCDFIYPSEEEDRISEEDDIIEEEKIGEYFEFKNVNKQIKYKLENFFSQAQLDSSKITSYSSITAAISKSLCYIHRKKKEEELDKLQARILVITVSPDPPNHYIPMMNSIFSAQRMGIPVDVIKLSGKESMFLQQGSYISNGQYLDLRDKTIESINLLQHLLFAFLPEHQIRNLMISPCKPSVDFRAACFCHKNSINVGFVCSVCLSIFCSNRSVCDTCQSKLSDNKVLVNTTVPLANGQSNGNH